MSLIPHFPRYPRYFDEMVREMERLDRGMIKPYWLGTGDALNVGNTTTELVNDDKKFGVSLDVSHFKPEELKVNLDGRVLTVEGNHEVRDKDSYMQRSFVRKWTLPDDCDMNAVRTSLSDKGHLCIDAPKTGAPASRAIPIEKK